MIFRFPFVLVCLGYFSGCTSDTLKPGDYVQYIRNPNNGFIQRQEQSGIFIEAFYQPVEYAALMQIPPASMNDTLFKEMLAKGSFFYQFVLSIGSNTALPIDEILEKSTNDGETLEKKKQEMFYGMQGSFALLVGTDSLPCIFYHAETGGKIDNAYRFILSFEGDSSTIEHTGTNNLTLIYTDSIWLKKRFDFFFDKNKIHQSPRVKL